MNPPGEQSRKKASINKEVKEASGEKAGGGKAMHLCAAKCKPRGECRQKGVGNPFFIQGNTAQFTAEALSVASLADFPATVTKMLANTQSIRCAFCLTCQKICRRDSTPGIVRYCSGRKRRVAVRKHGFLRQCAERGEGLFSASMVFKRGESPACRKSLKTRFSARTRAGRANTSYRKKGQ